MNKNITINPFDKTLTISKSFYKQATIYGTDEYNLLRDAMKECEGYEVIITTIQKKSYSGLTFKRMADYIMTQPNSEDNLTEFAKVMTIAEAKGSKYPLTKKWFLKTFPEYKLSEISEKEMEKNPSKSENITNINEAIAS